MSKVFGIGFHKTGTKSLQGALQILGYRVTGPNGVHDPDIARKVHEMSAALSDQYDAFADNPWPLLYREMDARHPGSKFILTVRPTADWIRSMVGFFGAHASPMREWIYGVGHPQGHEDVYTTRYEAHNAAVRTYFSDRPGDLLVIDLSEGGNWEKLCPFLGKPVPAQPFPWNNPSSA